jgi:hypothetical protein
MNSFSEAWSGVTSPNVVHLSLESVLNTKDTRGPWSDTETCVMFGEGTQMDLVLGMGPKRSRRVLSILTKNHRVKMVGQG